MNAPDSRPRRIVVMTLAANVLLCLGLFFVYWRVRSHLILAQGADSAFDLAAGIILAVTATVGTYPRDENHPFGHERAEPVGALVTAVLAGVLAIEVAQRSVEDLIAGESVELTGAVAWMLAIKLVVKLILGVWIRTAAKHSRSPALRASFVDTRNDVIATASSLVGYGIAKSGISWADAVLALPVAGYIGFSGIELARDNLRYLMGEAPEKEVLEEIRARAASVSGTARVTGLRAHFVGASLHVEVIVLLDGQASATQGHDLGVDIQQAVESHPLVTHAFVHIDTTEGKDHE